MAVAKQIKLNLIKIPTVTPTDATAKCYNWIAVGYFL